MIVDDDNYDISVIEELGNIPARGSANRLNLSLPLSCFIGSFAEVLCGPLWSSVVSM